MAKRTHQERIIRNYYKNRNEILLQNLGEIVSELWLAPDEFKKRKLWQRAAKALEGIGMPADEVKRLVESHDEKALARLLNQKF